MVRSTSIEVYLQIKREGLLGRRQQEVYECLYSHGPMNSTQIFNRLSLPTNQSGRITELELKGVIQEVGKAPCPITGRSATIWDVTSKLPSGVKRQTKAQHKELLRTEALELCKSIAMVEMSTEHKEQLRNIYKLIMKL